MAQVSNDATPPSSDANDGVVVVQRTRRAPFAPPTFDEQPSIGTVVTRNWGGTRRTKKDSGLTRNRVIAGDLPDWAPLPPGELQVDRNAGTQS